MIGLLGHNISYTFSPFIHKNLGYDYKVIDLNEDDFRNFMTQKNFKAINVTIPYKDKVIEYLDYIDPLAKKVNAVNTIVNKDGKLYGYNTDVLGFDYALSYPYHYQDIPIKDRKVLILGTGNTSESITAAVDLHKPKEIIKIGRTTDINYDNLEGVLDAQIIIDTTPVGVYPNIYESVIDLTQFDQLEAVIDVTYNPLTTKLIADAKDKGVKAFGGLLMLVAQAVFSYEWFFDTLMDESTIHDIYEKMLKQYQNIVLIGMPTAGKTTISKLLADTLNKKVYDVDEMIVEMDQRDIPEIFATDGEAYFRHLESDVIKTISKETEVVIATGGGSILDEENVKALKMNGHLVFIDRPLNLLQGSSDRPLSTDEKKLEKLYHERIDIYRKYADVIIFNDGTIEDVVLKIKEWLYEDTLS